MQGGARGVPLNINKHYSYLLLLFLLLLLKKMTKNTFFSMLKVPQRYLPKSLSPTDRAKQARSLRRSRGDYKRGRYTRRAPVASFKSHPSGHVAAAKQLYGVNSLIPGPQLAQATGCSIGALRAIVKKGEGAFYSSGSRPNQTPQSWGLARLGSAITGSKAAAVDYDILENGCNSGSSRALSRARSARRKYGHGQGATRKTRA